MLYDVADDESDTCDSENTESGFSDTEDECEESEDQLQRFRVRTESISASADLQGGTRERRASWRWHQRTLRRRARLRMRRLKDVPRAIPADQEECVEDLAPRTGPPSDETPEQRSSQKKAKKKKRSKKGRKGEKKGGRNVRRSHFRYCFAGQLSDTTVRQISLLLEKPRRRSSQPLAGRVPTPANRHEGRRGSDASPAPPASSTKPRRRSSGAVEIPLDVLEISLEHSEESELNEDPSRQPCEECERTPAEVLCRSCQASFCESCFQQTHSSKVFRRHLTRPLHP